jgi:hypothetical protein
MTNRNSKRILDGHGEMCPKCNMQMSRYRHADDWQPRPDQAYWYDRWDYCQNCNHVQHYEQYKRGERKGPQKRSPSTYVSEGERCPTCSVKMGRFEHAKDWKPREGQRIYYSLWDYCKDCKHVQHYDYFKRTVKSTCENDETRL